MRNRLINLISGLILTFGFLFLTTPISAYHGEWHDGPSCGECHCSPGQDCYNEPFQGGCGCTNSEIEVN
ncbi:hypothetical protein BH23THE1_BH23THE1_22520 [soil metagenome]